jgi:hypothetical protein
MTDTERQNIRTVERLLKLFAQLCPKLAGVLNVLADSIGKAALKDRIEVVPPGTAPLTPGDQGATTVKTGWTGRYMQTTLSSALFSSRDLSEYHCADMDAIIRLLATLSHEMFHRRCYGDPDAYDLNIAFLKELKNCINTDTNCAAEISAALDSQIAAETAARGDGPMSEGIRTALLGGAIGTLAAFLSITTGLAAAIVGAKAGGIAGSVGGPGGIAAGIGIGFIVAGATSYWYNPCES